MGITDSVGSANAFDFLHLRTRLSMTSRMRRHAIRLKHAMNKVFIAEGIKEEDIGEGEEDLTREVWIKILDAYLKEIKAIKRLERLEYIELREEEREEEEEEKIIQDTMKDQEKLLKQSINDLPKEMRDALDSLKRDVLRDIMDAELIIKRLATKKMVEQKDILTNRRGWTKYYAVLKDQTVTDSIRRLVWGLRTEVVDEKREEKEMHHEVSKLIAAIRQYSIAKEKGNTSRIDGYAKEVIDHIENLKQLGKKASQTLEKEAEELAKIIHYGNIIQLHILHRVENYSRSEFHKLAELGFSDKNLGKLEKKRKYLVKIINRSMWHLYLMARYDQKRA